MKAVRTLVGEVFGLFVETWPFALAIAACIAVIAALSAAAVGPSQSRAIALFVLLALTLIESTRRAA